MSIVPDPKLPPILACQAALTDVPMKDDSMPPPAQRAVLDGLVPAAGKEFERKDTSQLEENHMIPHVHM